MKHISNELINPISWFKFDTVTIPEVTKLMSSPRFQNLFRGMDELNKIPGFPHMWLITSIDRSSVDGELRFTKEGGNHRDSCAVDIVPLQFDANGKKIIRLPMPLNRLFLLQSLFRTKFTLKNHANYPIIAFESDHIHADINHDGDVVYLNKVKSKLDRIVSSLLVKAGGKVSDLNKAINDGQLYSVSVPYNK